MKGPAVPHRGDLVWLDFSPHSGHEQAGRRPAIILSPEAYNRKTGLAVACPITSHAKGYPFEVSLPPGKAIGGVILSDRVRNIDWKARKAEACGRADAATLNEVTGKLTALVAEAG